MANQNFSAQVDAWVLQSKKRIEKVFRESTQRTVSMAQENLRTIVNVQTGLLRASPRASLQQMPTIDPSAYPEAEATYNYNGSEISLTIAGAKLGDVIYVGWTAAYSAFVHNGTSRMAPRPYVALAAEKWQSTVNQVVSEAQSRAAH